MTRVLMPFPADAVLAGNINQPLQARIAPVAWRHFPDGESLVTLDDALAGAGENIGKLLSRRHYYFVPFGQDSPESKPTSMVADFSQIPEALEQALEGKQIQHIII